MQGKQDALECAMRIEGDLWNNRYMALITGRRTIWNGHIARMDENRSIKIARDKRPSTKRKLEDLGRDDDVKIGRTLMVRREKSKFKFYRF